jgi:hypothetical protein
MASRTGTTTMHPLIDATNTGNQPAPCRGSIGSAPPTSTPAPRRPARENRGAASGPARGRPPETSRSVTPHNSQPILRRTSCFGRRPWPLDPVASSPAPPHSSRGDVRNAVLPAPVPRNERDPPLRPRGQDEALRRSHPRHVRSLEPHPPRPSRTSKGACPTSCATSTPSSLVHGPRPGDAGRAFCLPAGR